MKTINIRHAVPGDEELILNFIKGIAEYEKMSNEVVNTTSLIKEYAFDKKLVEVIFAMEDDKEVGFALFFYNYSTFVGRAGIHLEDLFVYPEYRGKGYGKALFLEVVKIAKEKQCEVIDWACLNWNTPSINFYKSMGAIPMDEWTTYRLTEEQINKLNRKRELIEFTNKFCDEHKELMDELAK